MVYYFPVSATTNYYKLGGLKQKELILSQPGEKKSEIQVPAELVFSEDTEGEVVP